MDNLKIIDAMIIYIKGNLIRILTIISRNIEELVDGERSEEEEAPSVRRVIRKMDEEL